MLKTTAHFVRCKERINYAAKVEAVENMDGFYDLAINEETRCFNEAAMMVLGIEDSEGDYHYYGLPENQSFPMMFIRTDILADLNIDIPKTWDDTVTELKKSLKGVEINE